MGWFKMDDQFGVSRKVIRIPRKKRKTIIGLWTLAGNYAARALTDGVLEAHELDELDATAAEVAELVRVGLWHSSGHACGRCVPVGDGAVVIHDFLEYNPSREQILAAREAERVRKASYRKSKQRPSGTDEGTPGGSDPESEHPVPVPSRPPVPNGTERLTGSHTSSPESNRARGTDEGDLEALCVRQAAALGVDFGKARLAVGKATGRIPSPSVVMRIIATVLERATPPVKSPTGLVLTCIQTDWAEWQKFIDTEEAAA